MSSAMPSRQKTGSFSKGTMRPPPAPNAPRSFTQQRSQYPQSQAIPPSSIATIVQNYSKAGEGQAGLPNKDAFQQLLAEILGPEESGGFDEDISTNYKVIQVVTSAGLSTLFQDDPFANTEDQMLQASNSLLVIKLMIQRTPAVLFCPPPAENSQADHLLLYLWLMPRLFPLVGHPKAQALVVEFLETIEAMFFAVSNLQQYWLHLNIMVAYCRACSNCKYNSIYVFRTFADLKSVYVKRPYFYPPNLVVCQRHLHQNLQARAPTARIRHRPFHPKRCHIF
jgi:serine/threonine-protein kinase ATR